MTNPDNKLGVNAAFMGRTAPNTFNAELQSWTGRGIVSGFAVTPVSGMTISIGAADGVPDVAIVEDDIGNRLIMNNRTTVAIEQTLSDAPDTGSRIDAIVIYTNNPPEVLEQIPTVDNPTVCAMLVVEGEDSATPVAPDDTAIRTAITADDASGTTAYYAVLAYVTVENGVTDITAGEIEAGPGSYPDPSLQAGTNVQINGRTISATDTTYTAGTGLNLASNTFSADTTVLATQTNLTDKAVGVTESYTIADTDWAEAAGIYPFTHSTNISSSYTILDSSIVELINNQAVLFANYGFAIGSVSSSSGNLYLPIPEGTAMQGITATYNSTTGEITLNGTGSDSWSNPFAMTTEDLPVGTYTLSLSTPLNVDLKFRLVKPGSANRDYSITAGDTSVTFTITEESEQMRVWLSATNGAEVDWTGTIQLEAGSTPTTFRPYTGDGHSLTLYALDAPTTSVSLKINYKEGA